MHIVVAILLALAGIVVLLLIIALLMKREHFVKREIIINATRQKVFDYLKLLKNQDKFNKWAMADPDRRQEFNGTDGTVGFTISWNGDKSVGEGQKEIMKIIEGERIDIQIRFIRPMKTTADVIMETTTISDNQTKVSFSNAGTLKYPLNILIPIVEKKFPKEIDTNLANLKNILEKS
jgi:uncharacterized protein YndB with AHSA1/START domain